MVAESSKMGSARTSSAYKKRKSEIEDDENLKQALAEAPTRKPQRKGNAGKLAGLVSLPLDVLFEVSHLSCSGCCGNSQQMTLDIWSAKALRPPKASTNDEGVQTSLDAQVSYLCVEVNSFPSPWVARAPSWHERTSVGESSI
jgi:hypothetical protein